ncbi:MAG: DUF4331 domain-containing protein [Solirubrobacteraceae bacterium]|nr:DUF4331 domain-containing protein [Solirubrobacteraceae bacterium]
MSSHREAPEISQDPVADNTDTYAFVSPDRPDTVTILTNYVPAEAAAGGPNFYEFGTDVRYEVHVANAGNAVPDITYTFTFKTQVVDPTTFLYNTGPIESLTDPHFNRRQTYSITKTVRGRKPVTIATDLPSPPCNIGPHSTPNYDALAVAAVHKLPTGETVFAGQRNDGFFADLGAIFDLADLRPFQTLHVAPMAPTIGVDTFKNAINVHTIALQIPITALTRDGTAPKDPAAAAATIGIWGAASRRKMRVRGDRTGQHTESGPWVQVSRLGNPLFNELLVTMTKKDGWNGSPPSRDSEYRAGVEQPELSRRIPDLYPGQFETLRKLNGTARSDMVALVLTGVKGGIVPKLQNFTGPIQADMLRLNVAVPPATIRSDLGVIAGDAAGYPNGRRVTDDVVTIFVRALTGAFRPFFDASYVPDLAVAIVTQGVPTPPEGEKGGPGVRFLTRFPYLGDPNDGFSTPAPVAVNAAPPVTIPGVTP